MALPEGVKTGMVVTAKRAGWDEGLDPWQYLDHEPVSEKGYDSLDLEGVLVIVIGRVPGVGRLDVWLVGGQEADPKTVRPLDTTTDNVFCPTGEGGGVDPSCSPGQGGSGGKPSAQPLRDRWLSVFTSKMSGLPEGHRKSYTTGLKHILSQMSGRGLERFSTYCKRVNLYADRQSMTEALDREHPGKAFGAALKAGQTAGGCFDGGNGRLSMGGPYYTAETGWLPPYHGFAHEMTHAIDGPKREISQSDDWKAAHKAEAAKIGSYATTKYHESFAEFGRKVMASGKDRRQIEAEHPLMSAVWAKHGLWKED